MMGTLKKMVLMQVVRFWIDFESIAHTFGRILLLDVKRLREESNISSLSTWNIALSFTKVADKEENAGLEGKIRSSDFAALD